MNGTDAASMSPITVSTLPSLPANMPLPPGVAEPPTDRLPPPAFPAPCALHPLFRVGHFSRRQWDHLSVSLSVPYEQGYIA